MSKINSRIALVITDQETNAQIKSLGVGLLELRADLFKKLDPAYVAAQVRRRRLLKIPLLLTVRNQKKEGARKIFSDRLKWRIIEEGLPHVDMIDIEFSSPLLKQVVIKAHQMAKKVMISSHYLDTMPTDLGSILKKSLSAKADIVKIAAFAKSWDDVMDMIAFTHQHRKHPLITISLGPLGAVSRLILPAAGSLYTYTFLRKPTALGQLDVRKLQSHLKCYHIPA
ncbi:MAG: type I 3-dehydroquinate dehydratase [Candidatus Omnitrophica bacterium]|nr:type I 3-dehydroquinate dehydratase [Candidatus Omnitrophota bacterium]